MRREGALSYLEPTETTTRGVAVLDARADMIERAGLRIGDRLPPAVSLAKPPDASNSSGSTRARYTI